MELGIATGVVQLVDFTSKLLSKSYRIYRSADGTLEEYIALEDIAVNLQEISKELSVSTTQSDLKQMRSGKRRKLSQAEKLLENVRLESLNVTRELLETLGHLMCSKQKGKWHSFRQAVASIWKEREIRSLEKRMERIRRQLDTALLVCLRQSIEAPKDETEDHRVLRQPRPWQKDLLSEISSRNGGVESASDMSSFSSHLDRTARLQMKARFCRMILQRLNYVDLQHREQHICQAHRETFDWLFVQQSSNDSRKPWANFVTWLENTQGNNIYWVTGKAGSGKSTLIKFLYRNRRTLTHAGHWAGDCGLLTAGFFFWNSGSAMQKSRMGLLRSLLFQLLQDEPELSMKAFRRRWELYDSRGDGLQPWTWIELKKAFEDLISDKKLRFLFVIDGLDEFDGEHKELVNLIITAGKLPNVKICAASRPWLVFEDAFDGRPSLCLEDLTTPDIQRYIESKFSENMHYVGLLREEPDYAQKLVGNLIEKASGVFLWVYLIVDSLLQGMSNSDRISDLQRRLDAIPPELEDVFAQILGSVDPFYLKHACQLIQIVEAAKTITLLDLYLADNEDPTTVLAAKVEPFSTEDVREKEEAMRRRLNSRCRGLLEAKTGRTQSSVQYLHRTVKDFIQSPDIWEWITTATGDDFDPIRNLSHGYLLHLKTVDPSRTNLTAFWNMVYTCFNFSEIYQVRHDGPQVAYFDALDGAAFELTTMTWADGNSWIKGYTLPSQPVYWTSTGSGCLTVGSFLEYAIYCGGPALQLYACQKLKTMTPLDKRTQNTLNAIASDAKVLQTIRECSRKPASPAKGNRHKSLPCFCS